MPVSLIHLALLSFVPNRKPDLIISSIPTEYKKSPGRHFYRDLNDCITLRLLIRS